MSRQRTDGAFDIFYSATVADAQQHTDAFVLPRYRRPPKQVDRGSAPHRFTTAEEYYCAQYFEVLDLLAAEIARRSNQSSLALPLAVEELLIGYANNKGDDKMISEIIVDSYSRDVDIKKLKRQIQMLPDLASTYVTSQQLKNLQVTNVHTVAKMMLKVSTARDMFTEVYKLICLYFAIPITTATV